MTRAGYQDARQAQDARYEDVTGLSVLDTDRQEYRDYFGVGDHAGHPVESRILFQQWLVDHKTEQAAEGVVSEETAFELSGAQLAELAADGDWVAAGEIVRRAVGRWRKATGKVA